MVQFSSILEASLCRRRASPQGARARALVSSRHRQIATYIRMVRAYELDSVRWRNRVCVGVVPNHHPNAPSQTTPSYTNSSYTTYHSNQSFNSAAYAAITLCTITAQIVVDNTAPNCRHRAYDLNVDICIELLKHLNVYTLLSFAKVIISLYFQCFRVEVVCLPNDT